MFVLYFSDIDFGRTFISPTRSPSLRIYFFVFVHFGMPSLRYLPLCLEKYIPSIPRKTWNNNKNLLFVGRDAHDIVWFACSVEKIHRISISCSNSNQARAAHEQNNRHVRFFSLSIVKNGNIITNNNRNRVEKSKKIFAQRIIELFFDTLLITVTQE